MKEREPTQKLEIKQRKPTKKTANERKKTH